MLISCTLTTVTVTVSVDDGGSEGVEPRASLWGTRLRDCEMTSGFDFFFRSTIVPIYEFQLCLCYLFVFWIFVKRKN